MAIKAPVVLDGGWHAPLGGADQLPGTAVQLSADAGNALAYGSDGGLMVRVVGVQVFATPGTTTYRKRDGANSVRVMVVGGGGGGGDCTSGEGYAGSGGAGGGYAESFLTEGFDGALVVVGKGGVGGGNFAGQPPVDAAPGGTSSFGTLLSATGGAAGIKGITTRTSAGVLTRAKGDGGGVGSGGNIYNAAGQDGGSSLQLGVGIDVFAGRGGDSHLGIGGDVHVLLNPNTGNSGRPGKGPGAGGSGCASAGAGAGFGGAGADGIVIVWEYA